MAIQQNDNDIQNMFHLPLSLVATQECNKLSLNLQDIPQHDGNDTWTFNWGDSYSTSKMYKAMEKPSRGSCPFQMDLEILLFIKT
jgi:hypothetical protein